MTIIVENGSVVAGANSYIDDAYLLAFALMMGITLPATEAERNPLVFKAMDKVESFRKRFKGYKTTSTQLTQWPRQDVYIDDMIFESNLIPTELKKSQAQYAIDAIDKALFESNDGTNVKKEKLDVLEVEYFENGSYGEAVFAQAEAYIDELLNRTANSYKLRKV